MAYLLDGSGAPAPWIRRELETTLPLKRGAKGQGARRVQEWLNLHGLRITIDGDYGRVTEATVTKFQKRERIQETGIVDETTWQRLVAPLRRVLDPVPDQNARRSLPRLVRAIAERHLKEHPLEIGGQNRGPWVRLYMKGNEGSQWPWCAGFVTFVLKQAAEMLGTALPIQGSFSCDSLAAQAKQSHLYIGETAMSAALAQNAAPDVAAIFLVRRTSTDWTHTGFVTDFGAHAFTTIEGNTNDDGNREGYEVCTLTRGYTKKDFITLATPPEA